MIITRYGKCDTCRQPCSVKRDFIETIDMFQPESKTKIRGELAKEIKEWRKLPLYCKEHLNQSQGD